MIKPIEYNVVPAHTFDDLLVVPQYSAVRSRKDVDLKMKLGRMELITPIISANMSTVTTALVAFEMGKLGGLGILHRYQTEAEVLNQIKTLKENGTKYIVPSIGVQQGEFEKALNYIKAGATGICVDIAHGHSDLAINMVERLASLGFKIDIIGGNVCTYEGTRDMFKAGANIVKVGVGPGSACTTRITTGHGAPQAWAIEEAVMAAKKYGNLWHENGGQIIADGGIRNAGDAVKAFALGADAIMLGSLLAGCEETPGIRKERTLEDGRVIQTKTYAGMASFEARKEFDPDLNEWEYTPEGVATEIPCTGTLADVVNRLRGGIASGCSYSGVNKLDMLHATARMLKITAAGNSEGHPHILTRK